MKKFCYWVFSFWWFKTRCDSNTNRVVEKGDILLLNYMYDQSLLIALIFNYKAVKDDFAQNNLYIRLIYGIFKISNQPLPRIEDFQKFAIEQNLELFLCIK